jgi:hypothetical protein
VSANSFGQEAVFRPVQDLFSAMSAINHLKMKKVVKEDFQLLAAGEDWNIDDVINVVNSSPYKRRNYFNLI